MYSVFRGLMVAALAGSMTFAALAARTTLIVKFKSGASSTAVSNFIQGYDMTTYLLAAKKGQTMSIRLATDNTSCAFNLTAPGATDALFNGSVSGAEFTGTLPRDGTYSAIAYLTRNAARRGETCNFKLTFEVSG